MLSLNCAASQTEKQKKKTQIYEVKRNFLSSFKLLLTLCTFYFIELDVLPSFGSFRMFGFGCSIGKGVNLVHSI